MVSCVCISLLCANSLLGEVTFGPVRVLSIPQSVAAIRTKTHTHTHTHTHIHTHTHTHTPHTQDSVRGGPLEFCNIYYIHPRIGATCTISTVLSICTCYSSLQKGRMTSERISSSSTPTWKLELVFTWASMLPSHVRSTRAIEGERRCHRGCHRVRCV